MRRTRLALLLVALVPVAAVGAWVLAGAFDDDPPPGPRFPPPRAPVLPDLVVPPLTDVRVAWDDAGTRQILFSAAIANVGEGPFAVHAQRARDATRWLVSQRFTERDGSTSEQPIPAARMVWGGHGHDHWHVALGVSYRLVQARGGESAVRSLRKAGFCFFDQVRYRTLATSPPGPVVPAGTCNGARTTDLDMGLSVGWSDPYYWVLPDQRLDVTGLEPGVYRLIARADPDGWFRETDETDNEAWVEVRLAEGDDGNPTLDVVRASAPPS